MFLKSLLVAVGLTSLQLVLAGTSGKTSTTWDCCKPACAWNARNVQTNGHAAVCDINNKLLATNTGLSAASGCASGSGTKAYLCDSYMPVPVTDDLSYGFVSMNATSKCCRCYKLLFTSGYAAGKSMIVQSINQGNDLGDADMAILTPGGGIGQSADTGCKAQYGKTWGSTVGGVDQRAACANLPSNLQAGCYWRYNWAGGDLAGWGIYYDEVDCPDRLTSISGCTAR